MVRSRLYHTKGYQGTTTTRRFASSSSSLYHTKGYQGTTTFRVQLLCDPPDYTIPRAIRELQQPPRCLWPCPDYTIPRAIRELQLVSDAIVDLFGLYHTKGYQGTTTGAEIPVHNHRIIPYQGLSGNYNPGGGVKGGASNYTIPRAIRELQPMRFSRSARLDYTIPRAIRELQRMPFKVCHFSYYTIPRAIRELQRRSAIQLSNQ